MKPRGLRQQPAVGTDAAGNSQDFGTSRWQLFGYSTSHVYPVKGRGGRQMAQSVDWLSVGLRLQLGVHRKWSSDCQTGALDPFETFARLLYCW
jgi:hypothetical protein